MHKTEAEEALILLKQHGMLEELQPSQSSDFSIEHLKKNLEQQVLYLLERDFERLLQSLYRIDVPEDKFKATLISDNPAANITDLILQRELLKVQTRRWYAQRNKTALEE